MNWFKKLFFKEKKIEVVKVTTLPGNINIIESSTTPILVGTNRVDLENWYYQESMSRNVKPTLSNRTETRKQPVYSNSVQPQKRDDGLDFVDAVTAAVAIGTLLSDNSSSNYDSSSSSDSSSTDYGSSSDSGESGGGGSSDSW